MAKTLSEAEWHRAADLINAAALDHEDPCSVCGGQNQLLPAIVDVPAGRDPNGNDLIIPAITTICDKCGYVRQFSAVALGLFDEESDA